VSPPAAVDPPAAVSPPAAVDPPAAVSPRLAMGPASALGFARFAYGLLIPAMHTELHWNLAQAGTLTTGALPDRYGTGATLASTVALCAAGAVVSAAVPPRRSLN
jgi:hypothetical protein